MDRALNLEVLRTAIGTHERLPSPEQVQTLLADAEVSLFTGRPEVSDELLDTAWFLQAVATARTDLDLYDLPRQRRAHQVSGHIFDLSLQSRELSDRERLRYTFAGQVGYLGGELTPNAAALAARSPAPAHPFEWQEEGIVSLQVGIALLALDRQLLYQLLGARRSSLRGFASQYGRLTDTRFAAVDGVVEGAWNLLTYLTYGRTTALEQAADNLRQAIEPGPAEADVDSRWVAAHLLRLSGDLSTGSVWSVLPPDLPAAARAMTLGSPPVLNLWPPQLSFLSSDTHGASPLDASSRRVVLSFPTSAGKSLLAQLVIVAHLAAAPGDVCVVAPTHSLCREIADGLERRLRTLGTQLHVDSVLGVESQPPPAARALVMTPEKLAARLHRDPDAVLGRFSMFVVDEAHLVADPSRGWRLEETLSFLHERTLASSHRVVVLSAALGNQVHVGTWLETDDAELLHHSADWRGPRRLNAVYTTVPNWNEQTDTPPVGKLLPRKKTPLLGVLHLSTGSSTARGSFREPVGELVQRQKKDGGWTTDSSSSTRRQKLVPLVVHVSSSGAVLVVEATRVEAQRLAAEIAASMEDAPTDPVLTELVESRLGEKHPLAAVLTKGVAFHHAALPVDIQAEVEAAVRAGRIRVLVATSTLTEGVNLPFKTVVVASRGYQTASGYEELIDAAGLLNAVGRAGRAGRETEGWMILAEQQEFHEGLFEPLQQSGEDLELRSNLASEIAIAALQQFETDLNANHDSVFRTYGSVADGFLSFIWFLASESRGAETADLDDVLGVVRRTLAWHQLDDDGRDLLLRCAAASFEVYQSRDPAQRRRWAKSGTSLGSSRTLDVVAAEVRARVVGATDVEPLELIELVLTDDTLRTLLDLPENGRRGFKPRRNAPRDDLIDVDLRSLLLAWVGGTDIQELADRFLAGVTDETYRSEQLAEFSASVFEHHLPWCCGLVVNWANDLLQESGSDERIPEVLPGYIHYGVASEIALALMTAQVRSRRLANAVAQVARDEAINDEDLRDWLSAQAIDDWRTRFDASPTELLDLLAFVRAPSAEAVSELFDGERLEVPMKELATLDSDVAAELMLVPNSPEPAPIVAVVGGDSVAQVPTAHHDDVSLVLSIGVPLEVQLVARAGKLVALIALSDGGGLPRPEVSD